ncbi:MAG: peroxiredoxin-like family protein [Synechococcales bacterium]|nr:peroxiredoxin-like family protein [Synechococcales bacterium]
MSLSQQIAAVRAEFSKQVPAETRQVMQQATADLAKSALVEQALNVGDRLPDFTLPNATGEAIAIRNLLAQGSVVVSFYRGGWCPYCNLELRALQQALPEIQALGASLVAISPETPDSSLTTAEKNELDFQVLSDVGNRVARQFGLVFTLPEELRPIYEGFGIDIPAHNGDATFELPLAATYVVAADGTIVHAFVDADYTRRLEPAEIVAALKRQAVAV